MGRSIVRVGDQVDGHSGKGCRPTTVLTGSPNSTANGLPIHRTGDDAGYHCGHHRFGGPSTSNITCNGLGVVLTGDECSCGGKYLPNNSNISVG